MKNARLQRMCIAGLLCAIGILIPMLSPIKIQIPPMSFTLASHVPLFIALFVSPVVGITVALGTTLGFFLAGFPLLVVLRAAVQLLFVVLGGLWLAKKPAFMQKPLGVLMFGCILNLVHAACEGLVVLIFYSTGMQFDGNIVTILLGLVGVGTFLHGMFDYYLALLIWKPVAKAARIDANYK